MQLDVQWFVATLMANELISADDAKMLNQALGGEPDLMTYAQEFLARMTEGLSPEDAQTWLDQIQNVINYAVEQASTGMAPENAAEFVEPAGVAPAAAPAPIPVAAVPDGELPLTATATPAESIYAGEEMTALAMELNNVSAMSEEEAKDFMQRLLVTLREIGASDLHISANAPLFIRKSLVNQRLRPDYCIPPADAYKLNTCLLSAEQKAKFEELWDLNFAFEVHPSRFRCAIMNQREGVSGSYRIVPDKIHTLEELGFLPNDAITIERLLDYHNGLILVTGPLGSGKTTTLAAMIEIANQKRQDHIITVEDPIEIVVESKGCQVTQRQIGGNTNSYRTALKGALREDPDIIVIGEMHDLETIENAITASETGHLVIGTLHTCDAANTLNRLLDVFPPNQQPQIRAMTAGSLRGIVCQKLMHNGSGGLVLSYEILINTLAVSNVISEGKIFQLRASMQIGSKSGMCTIDQNLLELFKQNRITYEAAKDNMRDQSVIHLLNQEQAKRVATAK